MACAMFRVGWSILINRTDDSLVEEISDLPTKLIKSRHEFMNGTLVITTLKKNPDKKKYRLLDLFDAWDAEDSWVRSLSLIVWQSECWQQLD